MDAADTTDRRKQRTQTDDARADQAAAADSILTISSTVRSQIHAHNHSFSSVPSMDANPWSTPNLVRSVTTPAPTAGWRPATSNGAVAAATTNGNAAAAVHKVNGHASGAVSVAPRAQPSARSSTPLHSQIVAPSHPSTPSSIASVAAAAVPVPSVQGLSAMPARSNARIQFLQAATSLGLHGWGGSLPPVSPPPSHLPVAACRPRFDTPDGCSGLVDFDEWLLSSRRVLGVMSAHSAMHREVESQESQIVAREREQDTMDVIALSVIDHHAANSWHLAQHLSAVMSSQAEPAVQQREPQPKLVSTTGSSHFTAAPAQVHPHLRRLLQQPYSASASGGSFIQVEPELHGALVAGVEDMCKDVAQWSAAAATTASTGRAAAAASDKEGGGGNTARQITPPEALAWSSTLAAQQKPMVRPAESQTQARVSSHWRPSHLTFLCFVCCCCCRCCC